MSQCENDKTSDPDDKCLTLEDISAVGVSNAAEGSKLKDFLLLRKDLLPVCHDSSDFTEDNASLEANYGDESSCCVSDVSSLSFQNAVLDDPEYNSGCLSQTAGERSSAGSDWIGNDLQDASELSETVSELPDEPMEICDEVAEKGDFGEVTKDLVCDQDRSNDVDCDNGVEEASRFRESCDVTRDADKACGGGQGFRSADCGTSPRNSEEREEVRKKAISREKGGRNSEPIISSARSQQLLKSSPGLARRMLSGDGKTISGTRPASGSPHGQRQNDGVVDGENSSNDGATGGTGDREKRFEDQEKGSRIDVSDGKEVRSKDRDEQLKEQEKRDKIAHIDALYKRQIETLMQNQLDGESVDSSGSGIAKADIENEYNYVKYARVQDAEMYFGIQVAQDNDQHEVGKRLSSVSDHSLDGKESIPGMSVIGKHLPKQVTEPEEEKLSGCAELSLVAAEVDVGDKSLSCHMPSVEDGLSSGHASDCDEAISTRPDPSPAEVLKSRQKAEILSRPDSLPTSLASERDEDVPPYESSKTRHKDVEQAIQDIKSAIEKSKKVRLISPTATNDDQTKQVSENGREPVWITRKEHAKDLPRQPAKNPDETTSNDSTKNPKVAETDEEEDDDLNKTHATGSKTRAPTKDALSSLGTQSMIRRHNKQYMSLPSGDTSSIENERDGDNDESSTTPNSHKGTKKYSNRAETVAARSTTAQNHSTAITGNGYATAVGQEPLDQVRSTFAKSDLSAGKTVASEVAGIDLGTGPSRQTEGHASKHVECTCMEKSDEEADKPASRPVEGEYSTDEETDELLNKQYTRSEKVDIPELSSSPVNRSQSERRQTRAREVALRDPTNETVLIEGVLFRANYLGSTQLISDGQPSKGMRMMQAQEAVGRIKAPDGETQPSTEVDLFVSVEKIMVLNTDLQEIMMDHALRTISYIADIGDILVIMARRGPIMSQSSDASTRRRSQTKICCHVFESDEAQLIAQSIGQAFQVSYMEFLKANGIDNPSHIRELDYQEVLNQQEIFGEELYLFSNREMQKEVIVPKVKGEPLGVVIVESGWGSMVPTVVLANMSPTGAAARCGQLNIGDQIMSINGISLVGLPLSTCQNYIKVARHQSVVKLAVVSCPPVVEVLIKRPDIKYQLGFSVQNGVICSLLRGGIAERGGIRVGHRIIEINGQSVVAISHDKIVHMLATSVGEIQMKTMPTSIFRLLTGQDVPHYI